MSGKSETFESLKAENPSKKARIERTNRGETSEKACDFEGERKRLPQLLSWVASLRLVSKSSELETILRTNKKLLGPGGE